jgi:hypothetical protein
MRPNEVTPDARATSLRPFRWSGVQVGSDPSTVRVEFTTDGSSCQVLGRVDVAETARQVRLTLQVGQLPGTDCSGPRTQQAAPAITTVRLGRALGDREVIDGSPTAVKPAT